MAISNVTSLPGNAGLLLQIAFQKGFVRQLSQDLADFQLVQLMRVAEPEGREMRYLQHVSGGPAAIQSAAINAIGPFPVAQPSQFQERSAIFKELDVTVQISEALARRLASSSGVKYADQLAAEVEDKMLYSKRRVGADMHLDGTGVLGTISAKTDTTGAGGYVLVSIAQLDSDLSASAIARGHTNVFEFGDIVKVTQQDSTARTPTVVGTFYGYQVIDVLRDSDQVKLQPIDSSGAALSLTSSGIAQNDVIYRVGQPTILDLTGSIADYGSATEVSVGLESLVSADGRVVNGVPMSGSTRAIVQDRTGQAPDIRFLQSLVSALKNRNGANSYNWNRVLMATEALDIMSETWRQDRRFIAASDGKLGAPEFVFQHGKSSLEFYTTEFARKNRFWVLGQGKGSLKTPIQLFYSDFQPSKSPDGGSSWNHVPTADGRHNKAWNQYMIALLTMINTAPAANGVVKNFSLS